MPEVSSPKQLLIKEANVDKTDNNSVNISRALISKEIASEIESNIMFSNSDIYTKKTIETSESIQKNTPQTPESPKNNLNQSPTTLLLSSMYSKMLDPLVKIQANVDRNKQLFIDITDKLAAIYGEKEKDIKDKLSDVFKRYILKPFNLISEINTSMQQKEHRKEKKIKDRDTKDKKREFILKKTIFSLGHWINYKLLEITGEILNLSRKFTTGIKKSVYKGFKKVKKEIVFTLDRIDSLFESKK